MPEGSPVFAGRIASIFQVTAPIGVHQEISPRRRPPHLDRHQGGLRRRRPALADRRHARALIISKRRGWPRGWPSSAAAGHVQHGRRSPRGHPTYGTQAHSLIMALTSRPRAAAGRRGASSTRQQGSTPATAAGAACAGLGLGPTIRGGSIDSSTLAMARPGSVGFLDERDWSPRRSGQPDLFEYIIDLLRRGASDDAFGVGTGSVARRAVHRRRLQAGGDDRRRRRPSQGQGQPLRKETLPGRKQVYRHGSHDELITYDILGLGGHGRCRLPGERAPWSRPGAGRRLAEPESPPTIQGSRPPARAAAGEITELRLVASRPRAVLPWSVSRQAVRSEHAAGSSNGAGGDTP